MNPYATTIYKLKHTTDETKDCYVGAPRIMTCGKARINPTATMLQS